MSKSLGNVLLVRDLVGKHPGEVLRLALLSAHYRQPLNWTDDTVEEARKMLDRFYGAVRGLDIAEDERAAAIPPEAFIAALEDDINTPRALAEMFNVTRELNKADDGDKRRALAASLLAAGDVIGLIQEDAEVWFSGNADDGWSAEQIDALLKEREEARANRNFDRADAIRDELAAAGIQIEDGVDGTRWRRS